MKFYPLKYPNFTLFFVHLRVSTVPTLHILGAYLESNPTIEEAIRAQLRPEKKVKLIKSWAKKCLIIGDLDRPLNKPTELPKTRMKTSWLESGKLIPQNLNPIQPSYWERIHSGLGLVTPNLLKSVTSFAVDQKKQWTPRGRKPRTFKKTTKSNFTDHRCIECKLYMKVLAAKDSGN